MLEKETGLAILDEVGHLIAVAANTGKTEGESFDEDNTVGFKIARHTKDITHIVIFGFFVEWYLTDEVIAINRLIYWVLRWSNDK